MFLPDSPLVTDVIPAKWFRFASRESTRVQVVHSTETAATDSAAKAVGQYFKTLPQTKQASSAYIIGPTVVVQAVQEKNIAYGAPGANIDGLQLELCGFAHWSWQQWLDTGVPQNAAKVLACYCHRKARPIQLAGVADLLAGKEGITRHWDVSRAYKMSDHTDPGNSFDMSAFLVMVVANLPEVDADPYS